MILCELCFFLLSTHATYQVKAIKIAIKIAIVGANPLAEMFYFSVPLFFTLTYRTPNPNFYIYLISTFPYFFTNNNNSVYSIRGMAKWRRRIIHEQLATIFK